MPDATGLELLAQDLREAHADAVLDTVHFRDKATMVVEPGLIGEVLESLASDPVAGHSIGVSGGGRMGTSA